MNEIDRKKKCNVSYKEDIKEEKEENRTSLIKGDVFCREYFLFNTYEIEYSTVQIGLNNCFIVSYL